MNLLEIERLISDQKGPPPLHLWSPELSGDMDMRIAANGDWVHEGEKIQRLNLVKLFASILRREDDGDYYLVTPVEKWRITVDDLPLMIIAYEYTDHSLALQTNTEQWFWVKGECEVRTAVIGDEPRPYVQLPNGLSARLNRNVFYDLVSLAQQKGDELLLPLNSGSRCSLGYLSSAT